MFLPEDCNPTYASDSDVSSMGRASKKFIKKEIPEVAVSGFMLKTKQAINCKWLYSNPILQSLT